MKKFVEREGDNLARIQGPQLVGYEDSPFAQQSGIGAKTRPVFEPEYDAKVRVAQRIHLGGEMANDLTLEELQEHVDGMRAQRDRMRAERAAAIAEAKAEHAERLPRKVAAAQSFVVAVEAAAAETVLSEHDLAEVRRMAQRAVSDVQRSRYVPADDYTLPPDVWFSLATCIEICGHVLKGKLEAEAVEERKFRARLQRAGLNLDA